MPLHDFQQQGHEDAIATLRAGRSRLYVSPTGSGKSYVQAANHDALRAYGLVTAAPTTDILLGIYEKLAGEKHGGIREYSEAKTYDALESAGLWTIMRLHNALVSARIDPPKMLQFDEGHHTTAGSYETVHTLCGDCPAIAYTATGFRGTPEETTKLKAKWGEPKVLLTLKAAVDRGIISRPDMHVWPLLDDETITITNGEFETKKVESALKDVAEELVNRIRTAFCTPREPGSSMGWYPKRPTMVTAPGVASARHLTALFRSHSVSVVCITGDECVDGYGNTLSRQVAFKWVVKCEAVLVQVNVVGEGVDLPIRVLVDAAPTMSPVRWLQRLGRGTRPTGPGEPPPVYICTNHNLARHGYLWAGVLPRAVIAEAQQAWGPDFKPSRRILARAIGLDGFGKFVVSKIPLTDGTYASLYALQTPDGTHQYAVLLHACLTDPLFFQRTNPHTGEIREKTLDSGQVVRYKVKDYGPWKRIPSIPNVQGYVSTKPGSITTPMLNWWERSAERCGIEPGFTPNAREFQVLPILVNTRTSFKETA